MRTRPDLAALALCALIVVAVTACAILHVEAPPFLAELGLFIGGVGGGVALNHTAPPLTQEDFPPAASSSTPPAANLPVQAPAPAVESYGIAAHAP